MQRLSELQKQGADYTKLKAVLRVLRAGRRPRARQYHDHALQGPLTGWRSATIGTALWMPQRQQRIVMVYQLADGGIDIVYLDLHDQAYSAALSTRGDNKRPPN